MGNQQSTLAPTPVKGGRAHFLPATSPPISLGTLKLASVEKLLEGHIDLARSSLGTTILECSDEFFAGADNLLKPTEAISRPGEFTDNGAWMDGWETRRHNIGYDWTIVRLGYAGIISAFDIDTAHFKGNHAPFASVEGTFSTQETPGPRAQWREILPKAPLEPNSHNYFGIDSSLKDMAYTHLRLKIYPDGGVARFRVYGDVSPVFPPVGSVIDLAGVGFGGKMVAASNQHFSHGDNLILPSKGKNMGDGWETRRSREPKHSDWVVLRLGAPGRLERVCVDTAHFKGNFPQTVELYACRTKAFDPYNLAQVKATEGGGDGTVTWFRILDRESLSGNKEHEFKLKHMSKVFTHVRMVIYPDGGVSRLRVWGTRDPFSPTGQGVPGTLVDAPKKRSPGSKPNESGGKNKKKRSTSPTAAPASKGKGGGKGTQEATEKEDAPGIGQGATKETGVIRGIAKDLGINQTSGKAELSTMNQDSSENFSSGETGKEVEVSSLLKESAEVDVMSPSEAAPNQGVETSPVRDKGAKPKRKIARKTSHATVEKEDITIRMGGETVGKGQRKRMKRSTVN